jgi:hypothetical protein
LIIGNAFQFSVSNLSLGGKADLVVLTVEDNVLALEEDITKNVQAKETSGLKTTVAERVGDSGVVEVLSGDGGGVAADGELQVWKSGITVKDVATLEDRVHSAGDLVVVCLDNVVAKQEKGGTSVSNSLERVGAGRTALNFVAVNIEQPVTLAGVDVNVGEVTSVLGGVDEAEVVGTRLLVLQGDGEDRLVQGVDDVEVEGLLGKRLDLVDGRVGQTEKTVAGSVLGELSADGLSGLNSLGSSSDTANNNGVLVDITAGRAAIAVGDVPGETNELLSASAGGVEVDTRAGTLGVGGVDPAVDTC